MRTSFSKENILKSGVLFLSISAFILTAILFISCSDSERLETIAADDETLITQIESASTIIVESSSLPAAASTVLNSDFADSYVTEINFAEALGYKVSLNTDDASKEEVDSDVFFSKTGKQLADANQKRTKRRNKCFSFVFPIDFIMPDDSSITLNSYDDWTLIRDWYEVNTDVTERPELLYPVDVTLEDGTIQTLIDSDELYAVKDSCKKGKDKRKCFKLVLPVSFTMEDATVIEVAIRKDFKLLREWRKANTDATIKPILNFPLDIIYKDGTTVTLADQTEYNTAKEACN
ncbi:MAG: hypothetical protein ABJH82_03705 [Polaribacter sp.]|uniref:hypothetical protein n=1 Tax=Polaribacter sp. TaxID=1920175 RepID=UPI003266E7B6